MLTAEQITQLGLTQVPPEVILGKTLYAHPTGYFMNTEGERVPIYVTPCYSQIWRRNKVYPQLGSAYGCKDCHYLMVCTFIRIPDRSKGEVIDHIDGNELHFSIDNLRITDRPTNDRDGGFIKKLRNKKIDPSHFSTPFLLRFFDRMAEFKENNTICRYRRLSHDDLLRLIVSPEFTVGNPTAHLAPFH